jgi:hypothetical protein
MQNEHIVVSIVDSNIIILTLLTQRNVAESGVAVTRSCLHIVPIKRKSHNISL